ncbi:MAG: hypothetical protein EBS04_08525 [Chitinophagia bacterium]|nr:hypothetical protein [Chitinophagia bacterium]
MEVKMKICLKCEKEFPLFIKIDGKNRNLKNRKYCLNCSPFGLHNTQKINSNVYYDGNQKINNTDKICKVCGESDKENFYGHKKNICGKCHNKYVIEKGRDKKDFARNLLGGKCSACGFHKYKESLDIHHLNPKTKDHNFSSMRGWSIERITSELKNCILLCKNCHTAYHCGYDIGV